MNDSFDDTQDGFNLTDDQMKVLNMIWRKGIDALSVRNSAKKAGVERPLNIIGELYELGFIGKRTSKTGVLILTRIR